MPNFWLTCQCARTSSQVVLFRDPLRGPYVNIHAMELAHIVLHGPGFSRFEMPCFLQVRLISNHFACSVGGPEKAAVGGSIPSLATIFSITCELVSSAGRPTLSQSRFRFTRFSSLSTALSCHSGRSRSKNAALKTVYREDRFPPSLPSAVTARNCSFATGRSLTLAVLSGTASVRSCEEIGWQAEAPAPPRCKSFECNVGQTLSSVNPAVRPISSQLLSERPGNGTKSHGRRPRLRRTAWAAKPYASRTKLAPRAGRFSIFCLQRGSAAARPCEGGVQCGELRRAARCLGG